MIRGVMKKFPATILTAIIAISSILLITYLIAFLPCSPNIIDFLSVVVGGSVATAAIPLWLFLRGEL